MEPLFWLSSLCIALQSPRCQSISSPCKTEKGKWREVLSEIKQVEQNRTKSDTATQRRAHSGQNQGHPDWAESIPPRPSRWRRRLTGEAPVSSQQQQWQFTKAGLVKHFGTESNSCKNMDIKYCRRWDMSGQTLLGIRLKLAVRAVLAILTLAHNLCP